MPLFCRSSVCRPALRLLNKLLIVLMVGLSLSIGGINAQDQGNRHPTQVFLGQREDGRVNLIFIDLLTGEERRLALIGAQFTIMDNGVMFFDQDSRRVKLSYPEGSLQDHPFIQPTPQTRRIDWLVSGDRIFWTNVTGSTDALLTETWMANTDGSNSVVLFRDGPRSGIRAFPVATSEDGRTLFMDYQPDTIGDITPLRQYAGLFAIPLLTGIASTLPNEPGCFCGAGFGGGWFLRLALSTDGFDLHAQYLATQTNTVIPALVYPGFTQAGGFLIAPEGNRAVYVMSRLSSITTPNAADQRDQTIFVMVDLVNRTQRALGVPVPGVLRPVEWRTDGSGIVVIGAQAGTTWKLNPENGEILLIADSIYLGVLGYN